MAKMPTNSDQQPAIKWTVSPFANWSTKYAMSELARIRYNLVLWKMRRLNKLIALSYGNDVRLITLRSIYSTLNKQSKSLDKLRSAIYNRPYMDGALQRV